MHPCGSHANDATPRRPLEFRATPACMAAMPCLASRNSELACLFHQLAPACVVANGVLRVRGACRIFLVYYVSHVLRTWRG